MISSRFDSRIPYYLISASICSALISLFLFQLFLGLLSVLWLCEKNAGKKKAFDLFTILICTFGMVRILSIILSNFPEASIPSLYKDALFYFGFFSVSFYLKSMGIDKVKKIAIIFPVSAVVVAISGLILFNLNLTDRATSFSSGASTFSSFLLVAVAAYIVLPYNDKTKFNWMVWASGLSIIFTGIITSLGRTNIAIAGLLFITGIVLKKITLKAALSAALLTIILTFISFHDNDWRFNQRMRHPISLSDRNVIWKVADSLKFNHPFLGYGPRTFHNIFPAVNNLNDKRVGSWHNDFIQVYLESGIFGLIFFAVLIITPIYLARVNLRKVKAFKHVEDILLGVLLGISALVLSAFTAGFIDSPVLSVLFAMLIALLTAIKFYTNSDQTDFA